MRAQRPVGVGREAIVLGLFAIASGATACAPLPSEEQAQVDPVATASFLLVAPPEGSSWTRIMGVAADGQVVVGTAGDGLKASEIFRWKATDATSRQVGWIEPPALENDEPLGVLHVAVSKNGKRILADVFAPSSPTVFTWNEGDSATTLLRRMTSCDPGRIRLGVNPDGSALFVSSESETFRWTSGTGIMTSLGIVPGDAATQATAISDDGKVIAGNSVTAIGGAGGNVDLTRLFRWTESAGIKALPMLEGEVSCLTGKKMSAAGDTVAAVCLHDLAAPHQQVVRWTTTKGTEVVRALPPQTDAQIVAMNASGSTLIVNAGERSQPTDTQEPRADVVRISSTRGELVMPARGCAATSKDGGVAKDGSVIGSCGSLAQRWDATGAPHTLAPLTGFTSSTASSISDDGTLVVGWSAREQADGKSESVPVVWTAASRDAQPLNDFLGRALGAFDTQGTSLVTADISGDGKTFYGRASRAGAVELAWIARLP